MNKIELNNFQSHENTVLDLHPGINMIVGSSNSGKSAILRAINWIVYNRPTGDIFKSHWSDNDVSVRIDDIIRFKDEKENGYKIKEKKFLAINKDVPDEVKKILNIEDINIQKQLDKSFLLSESAGDVARFFNKTIRLDIIDKILSVVDSKKRKTKQKINVIEEQIKENEIILEKYDWIDKAEEDIIKYELLVNKENELNNKINKLENGINEFNNYKNNIVDIDFDVIEKRINKTKQYNNRIDELNNKIENLEDSIEEYKNNKNKIIDVPNINNLIYKTKEYLNKENELNNKINLLKDNISEIKRIENEIKLYNINIKDLEEKLPELCPLCGGKMK